MAKIKESFAVLGLSKFGYRTATGLFKAGATVVAVDWDEEVVQRIAPSVTRAIKADALDFEALAHVGVFETDVVVIGFRSAFDAAVLLVHRLRKRHERARIIVQVDTDEKAEALRLVGADQAIFPEQDIADRLVKNLTTPDLVEHIALSPEVAIVEAAAPPEFVGRTLTELGIRAAYRVHVVGIKRATRQGAMGEIVIAPPPDTRFRTGDSMLLLGRIADLQRFSGDRHRG